MVKGQWQKSPVLGAIRKPLRPTLSLRRIRLHIARNTIHFAGQYLWALALTLLPLATVEAALQAMR